MSDKFVYKATDQLVSFVKELPFEDADILTMQTVINSMTGTSVDVKIQHSLDGGVNKFDAGGLTQAQMTAAGSELDKSTGTHVGGKAYLVVTMVAITALDIEFYVHGHNH